MHSCLYLHVRMYRDGPKTDCSTVLGLFTSRSEGKVNVITTDVRVKGHMHRVRNSSYGWVQLVLWRHRTEHCKVTILFINNITSPHVPFLLLNTLNKEFSATGYCVTLYKDISIASPWDPWVLSQYWDWKTWIWSQNSSRAVEVDPRLSAGSSLLIYSYCRVCFVSIWVFVLPTKAVTRRITVLLLWFGILLWSRLVFFFNF